MADRHALLNAMLIGKVGLHEDKWNKLNFFNFFGLHIPWTT